MHIRPTDISYVPTSSDTSGQNGAHDMATDLAAGRQASADVSFVRRCAGARTSATDMQNFGEFEAIGNSWVKALTDGVGVEWKEELKQHLRVCHPQDVLLDEIYMVALAPKMERLPENRRIAGLEMILSLTGTEDFNSSGPDAVDGALVVINSWDLIRDIFSEAQKPRVRELLDEYNVERELTPWE